MAALGTRLCAHQSPSVHAKPYAPFRTHARMHAGTQRRNLEGVQHAQTPQSDRRATCLCIAGNINIAIYARFNCSASPSSAPQPSFGPATADRLA